MINSYHCPSCSKPLERSGELAIDGQLRPVFQCDSCTKTVDMFGETMEVALTFYVNAKGEPVDPADD